MNERILELANEANKDIGYTFKLEDANQLHELMGKFAELIVRECAEICMKEIDTGLLMAPQAPGIAKQIMKHFGVEEQEKVASKPECSVCGTTENVKYMGGYQPYLCDSVDCIPF